MNSLIHLFKKHSIPLGLILLTLVTTVYYFSNSSFAVNPPNPFTPGTELDPDCLPTDSNCYVRIPNFANDDLTLDGDRNHDLDGNDLAFTGTGNVGIGIASPTSTLHIVGSNDSSGTYAVKIGGATTSAIYALNSGDVAIGKTIPGARLDIQSDNNNNGEYALRVRGLTTPGLGVYKNGKVSIGNADYFSGVGSANGMTYSTTNAEDYFVIAANGSYRHAFGWESGGGGSILMYPNDGTIANNIMNINHSYNSADHITTGRNFGLGTRTASAKLHVLGANDSSGTYALKVEGSDGTRTMQWRNDGRLTLGNTNTAEQALHLVFANNVGNLGWIQTFGSTFTGHAFGQGWLNFEANANVGGLGIGTGNDNKPIVIYQRQSASGDPAASDEVIGIRTGKIGIGYAGTSATYLLDVNGVGRTVSDMYVGGNLGVGTTSPSNKLDVAGLARAFSDTFGGSEFKAHNPADDSYGLITNYGLIRSRLGGVNNVNLGSPVGGGLVDNYINQNLNIAVSPSSTHTHKGTLNVRNSAEAGAGPTITLVSSDSTIGKVVLIGNETGSGTGVGSGIRMFDGSAVERVRFTAGGTAAYFGNSDSWVLDKLGIGTTSPGSKLEVSGGDVYVEDQNSGVILKDRTLGTCKRIYLDSGVLTNEVVTCP